MLLRDVIDVEYTVKIAIIKLIAVLLILGSVGCTVGPDYQKLDLDPTTQRPWQAKALETESSRISTQMEPVAMWWQQFGDEELIRLISDLARQNLTLVEARQRIVAAQAIRGKVRADRLPQLDMTGNVGEAGTGEKAISFNGPQPGEHTEIYSAGLSAAWELDLWGRVARLTRAADAEVDMAVEDYHAAAVSIAADLATAYIDFRILQSRIEVLDRNIDLLRKTLMLAQSELNAGVGTKLDVAQAQRQLSQTLAMRPVLLDAAARSENRIAVLLGCRPGENVIHRGEVPRMPQVIGLGLPADLVERRADVRRAIAAYRGAVERIGAAEAEKYPSITLSGTLNIQATDMDNMGRHAYTYNLGPGIQMPLFDGGRINANVYEKYARAQELRAMVERTLLEAIGEVEDAAVGVIRNEARMRELSDAVTAAGSAADFAFELYRSGQTSLLQVVDAQRELVDTQDNCLVAQRDALAETIHLYRALGGGWHEMSLPAPECINLNKSAVTGNNSVKDIEK